MYEQEQPYTTRTSHPSSNAAKPNTRYIDIKREREREKNETGEKLNKVHIRAHPLARS